MYQIAPELRVQTGKPHRKKLWYTKICQLQCKWVSFQNAGLQVCKR